MVAEVKTHVMSRFSLAFSPDSTFSNTDLNKLLNLDQITEENHSYRIEIAGAVADQVIDLSGVNSPTLVIVQVVSKFDGGGSTTEDDPAKVQFKVGSGTIFDGNFIAFFVDVDANTGQVTTDIKITTLADSNTIVSVYLAGAKT